MKFKKDDRYVKFFEDVKKFRLEFDEDNINAGYNHVDYKRARGIYVLIKLNEDVSENPNRRRRK